MLKSRLMLVLAALLLLLLLTGCSDDPVIPIIPNEPDTAKAIVMALETGAPVAGLKILAVDRAHNTPVAGPFITDAAGEIDFGVLPDEISGLLIFGGLDWQLHSLDSQYAKAFGADKALDTDKTSPSKNPLSWIVVRRTVPENGLPRIAGTVIDASTGKPLTQVVISTHSDLAAYTGVPDAGTDVTGDDGKFVVQEIAFALHPQTGNLSQIEPLFISRVGYQPRVWVHEPANGDLNVDISGVEIALTPLSAADTGVLTGRVLFNGAPQQWVTVGLGGFSAEKNGTGVLGQTAVTDVDGIYRFTGLAAGQYQVYPGFLLDDGFFFPHLARPAYTVTNDQTATAVDVLVFREISPIPFENEDVRLSDGHIVFSWTPVDDAADYTLFLEDAETVHTPINQYLWVFPPNTSPGWYRWTVVAQAENNNSLGGMQITAWIHLVE